MSEPFEGHNPGELLARELGADRVRMPNDREHLAARAIVEPRSVDEIAAIVRKCEAEKISLAPMGAARALSQLRREPAGIGISLARMANIVAYEAEDMTVVAGAGLSIGALNSTLGERGQRLPVDPRHPEATTLGALVGAAHAGPLRLSEGTARDLLIGIQYVGHGGRVVRAGGRVVKNVAGYDLMKVLTGSFGTLGIVTETTFKVRPIPENYTLAVAAFPDAEAAFSAAEALKDRLPLIHLEVISRGISASLGTSVRPLVLAGLGGIRSELEYQMHKVSAVLHELEMLDGDRARALYNSMRDLHFHDGISARMAVAPGELAKCATATSVEFIAHIGSGITEVWTHAEDPAVVRKWRELAHSAHGHLRVIAAPLSIRSQIDFFDLPNPGAFKLMQRLKHSFDPANIFNPGCFVGGI